MVLQIRPVQAAVGLEHRLYLFPSDSFPLLLLEANSGFLPGCKPSLMLNLLEMLSSRCLFTFHAVAYGLIPARVSNKHFDGPVLSFL